MAKILLTWELGAGIGHIVRLKSIGQILTAHGHQVVAAIKDIAASWEPFGRSGISTIPAPKIRIAGKTPFPVTEGYAHILSNVGWNDELSLKAAISAWQTIFNAVKPDLVVVDHSPAALLALRGQGITRVHIGTGFCCPPESFSLPIWNKQQSAQEQLVQHERMLLESANRILANGDSPPLRQISQLFNDVECLVLATYQELDQLGPRGSATYWGHWNLDEGIPPSWPDGPGPKIFAYLKSFEVAKELFQFLRQARCRILVANGGLSPELLSSLQSANIRVENQPIDMVRASAECDFAILNATHGATANILLAGKPCILVPLFMEQLLLARRASQIGAARFALRTQGTQLLDAVSQFLSGDHACAMGAKNFAERYRGWRPGQQLPQIVAEIEKCLPR